MEEESKTQALAGPDASTSSSTQEQQHHPMSEDRTLSTSQANPESKGEDKNVNRKTKMPPKPSPTHFLCIPLVTASSRPQLARSLAAFRQEVTVPNPSSAYGALPVPEEAIRPVGTIHLTLGVMSFLEPKVGKPARHGRDGGNGRGERGGPQDDGGRKDRSRSGSRTGSRNASEEKGGSGSLSGLRKLEEAKALLKSLKPRETWQEVLRQSQTPQVTAVPVPRDDDSDHDGGAPIAIGTAEEKGEGLEVGTGTVVRDVQPQSRTGTGKNTDDKGEEEEGLKITLRGLHAMQPPSKAAVLYAPPVDPLGHLQRFCEKVKDVFVQKGLMMEEGGRPLLLHATVVNTIYVKGGRGQQQAGGNRGGGGGGGKKGHHSHRGGGHGKERLTIDAREILERYEEYTWMEDVKVEQVAICKMGAKKMMVDGVVVDEAYEVEEEVDF
ncbi:hypothetical protein QBC32DRAFT_76322 [Pseudoneurospora amorphoporcata]|uniref:A-kinase anchor protein 7-like phosphoesterase domain-containing protein n=1 Tax=Pseudoneurospora amorphoporcata TaxID=241081 RepID=A0AAN6P2X7_9PEZI|nr:hypothetical protein QBC32DRAFT_76322 [Pseudoneurospora amorphoporcata]